MCTKFIVRTWGGGGGGGLQPVNSVNKAVLCSHEYFQSYWSFGGGGGGGGLSHPAYADGVFPSRRTSRRGLTHRVSAFSGLECWTGVLEWSEALEWACDHL